MSLKLAFPFKSRISRKGVFSSLMLACSLSVFASPGSVTPSAHATAIDKEFNQLLDSCEYYISRHHWVEAEATVRKCLKKYPASPLNGMLFYNLGMAQIGQEKYSEAEQSLTVALVRSENNPHYLLGRAKCRMLLKRPEEAMEDLDRIITLDSLNYDALFSRSIAQQMEGRFDKSAADLHQILRHKPDDTEALSALGNLYVTQGEYSLALPILEKAVSQRSNSDSESDTAADDHFMLILSQLELNKESDAEEAIREALKHFPRDGRFYMTRAILARRRYQNNDAALDKKLAAQYGVESQILDYFLPDIH